jgi:hypothetical protein
MLEVLHVNRRRRPQMEAYAGQQYVGIDLHRRRSVITRMTEAGEVLEQVEILNDVERLGEVLTRCGEHPDVILEACYGWVRRERCMRQVGGTVEVRPKVVSRV